MEYFKPIVIIILFFVVLYGGYYFSVRLKTPGIKNLKSNGLKVIQGLYIGPNQSLQLVKIYGKYAILGVTKERISLIMELSEDELVDLKEDDGDFNTVLKRFARQKKN